MPDYILHPNGLYMEPEPILRERRRGEYEAGKTRKTTLNWWESNGYGYRVWESNQPDEDHWGLSRTDLTKFYSVVYTFYTREELELYVDKRAWRSNDYAVQVVMEL